MKTIPLTKGKAAIVDDDLFASLSKHKWHYGAKGYAVRAFRKPDGRKSLLGMHRVVCPAPDGLEVDHINGDALDNRASNLRLCTKKENKRNRKNSKANTSGFKGVHFDSRMGMFRARIRTDTLGNLHLGWFETAREAAAAYSMAAVKHHGEFVRT
jgi:hypothetical protein